MKYEDLVKAVAADVKEKFSPDQQEEIWNWLSANIDNCVISHEDDDHEEDINPREEFFHDVMEEAFGKQEV